MLNTQGTIILGDKYDRNHARGTYAVVRSNQGIMVVQFATTAQRNAKDPQGLLPFSWVRPYCQLERYKIILLKL